MFGLLIPELGKTAIESHLESCSAREIRSLRVSCNSV